MRIKFKKISLQTALDQKNLMNNISEVLDRPGYSIVKRDQNSVEFSYRMWGAGINFNNMNYIDGGRFEIDSQNKLVLFSYYLSPTIDILANSFALALIVFVDYHYFYFLIFFLIVGLIRLFKMRENAFDMLERITNYN